MGDFQTHLDHSANVRVCRPSAAIFDTFQNIQRIDKYVWLRHGLSFATVGMCVGFFRKQIFLSVSKISSASANIIYRQQKRQQIFLSVSKYS